MCYKVSDLSKKKSFKFTNINLNVIFIERYFPPPPKKKMKSPKLIEKEKIVAEQLNGRFAMLGFIAAIGAYLTTGQIIPGVV